MGLNESYTLIPRVNEAYFMVVDVECQGSTPSNSSSMEMNFIDIFREDPLVVYLSSGTTG